MKRVLKLFIFFIMFIPIFVDAETLQDKTNDLANLQNKYNTIKNKKSLTESQIKSLNSEINSISINIDGIIEDISKAEKDIKESKEKIEDKKIETNGLIQFLQVSNGGNIYLEYLFDAENYTDFIYRYEVVKQLTNYNSDLIDELEALIIDLNNKEKELSTKKSNLEKEREELQSKVITLNYNLNTIKEQGLSIEDEIKVLQKEIEMYKNMGCSMTQDLSTCSGLVNAYGWTYPIYMGCVTSEYTGYSTPRTDWSGGGYHFGIDLSCVSEGTNVYPAAAGQIAAIVRRYWCGGNMVYINHIVKGEYYTTVYMHLLSIDDSLYVGKNVTTATVIGRMGGGSTTTDPSCYGYNGSGYDSCTCGAHLHFGMAYGWNSSAFNSYSFNPRYMFNFPQNINYGGGYFYK